MVDNVPEFLNAGSKLEEGVLKCVFAMRASSSRQ